MIYGSSKYVMSNGIYHSQFCFFFFFLMQIHCGFCLNLANEKNKTCKDQRFWTSLTGLVMLLGSSFILNILYTCNDGSAE